MTIRISIECADANAAIRLLQMIGGAASVSLEDNPGAGQEVVSPGQAFGESATALATGPSAAAAFGHAGHAAVPVPPAGAGSVGNVPSVPPVTGGTSTPAGADLDSEGLPYDTRIHSETRSKNKDGTWKVKRGADKTEVARVKAELHSLMRAPGAGFSPAPTAAAAPAPAPAAYPSAGGASGIPPIPPVPGFVAPAAAQLSAPPAAPSMTFVELIGKYSPLIMTGKLTQDEVKAACTTYGVPDLPLLASRPDLVPSIDAHLSAVLMSKG